MQLPRTLEPCRPATLLGVAGSKLHLVRHNVAVCGVRPPSSDGWHYAWGEDAIAAREQRWAGRFKCQRCWKERTRA